MFGASVLVLFWAGARGLLLLGLALLISALLSYVLLNKQRTIIADKLNGRLGRVGKEGRPTSASASTRAPPSRTPTTTRPHVDPEHVVTPDAEEPVLGFPKA